MASVVLNIALGVLLGVLVGRLLGLCGILIYLKVKKY